MHRWKLSALAAAAFVTAAMTSTDAAALALGPLRVESALGENLRAEIAIPQATAAELNNLVVQIASPEIFRAQGMDYSASARAIQVQLLRKADGTASLRLTSNAPLQDPFVDVVIDTQWSTGHLVRSYTVLLDPPAAQRSAASPVTPAQVATEPVAGQTYRSNESVRPRATAAAPAPAPISAAKAASATPGAATPDETTRVRPGDTASRLANANRQTGVSLDQMLVAMLRSNPQAFINGNVNRIRAGAVVQMPGREQALETTAPEARRMVAAQSRDFNAYRRSLASKAPQAAVQAADRSSSGQVQAHVADARPAADTPDKLTLSKGSMQSAVAEEQLAAKKQATDQDNRLSELQRNLTELNELTGTTPSTATASAAADTAAPAAAAAEPAAPATPATPAVAVENATAAATDTPASTTGAEAPMAAPATSAAETETVAPAPAQSTPAPAAAAQPPAPSAPVAPAEASVSDELLDNPLVPAGAGLVALLLGLLGYSAWKRRRAAQAAQESGMGDSQLHADSFFGGSGGQQVDTSSAEGAASTMAYAPSQLDGGGEVDPVAEADVYLAYGRDVQAEEILKEALRNQPERLSVHVKLAEIYVKRHDIQALEDTARALQTVSHSQGPEWQRVVEMGRHMDPANAFFAAAGAASNASTHLPTSAFAAALSSAQPDAPAADLTAPASAAAPQMHPMDLHLDLPDDGLRSQPPAATAVAAPQPSDDDFAALELPSTWDSALDLSAASEAESPPTLVQDTLIDDLSAQDLSGLDLDLSGFEIPAAEPAPRPSPDADITLPDSLDFDLDSPAATAPQSPAAAPATPNGLDFDLGSLDLDLGPTSEPAAPAQPVHNLADDPLSTKLDLAQEFNAIGDSEGARALIEEVLEEASGSLKERAQKMLSEID